MQYHEGGLEDAFMSQYMLAMDKIGINDTKLPVEGSCRVLPMENRLSSQEPCPYKTGGEAQENIFFLELKHYRRLFIIYGVGIGLSVISFLGEWAVRCVSAQINI